ncbi:9199_t:CDS:2 [Diversispora eburnea]|uniref:9199_t:CDS:1 n=1 Tax=Diversispora eburnea TaxID=1213867 RepID=A0A9N9EZF2_9GLOM|nr:9199_t:CDS:2 [Diversispora eburnea]
MVTKTPFAIITVSITAFDLKELKDIIGLSKERSLLRHLHPALFSMISLPSKNVNPVTTTGHVYAHNSSNKQQEDLK